MDLLSTGANRYVAIWHLMRDHLQRQSNSEQLGTDSSTCMLSCNGLIRTACIWMRVGRVLKIVWLTFTIPYLILTVLAWTVDYNLSIILLHALAVVVHSFHMVLGGNGI